MEYIVHLSSNPGMGKDKARAFDLALRSAILATVCSSSSKKALKFFTDVPETNNIQVNNYIVRSYRVVIVVTNTVTLRIIVNTFYQTLESII